MKTEGYGVAGRLAAFFLESKLTPLLMIAALLLGALAIIKTPREEEPQIVVPFADVMVGLPGADAAEVEDRIVRPLERLLKELPGVEYVYAVAMNDAAMVTVRFQVGWDQERALVNVYDAMSGSMDRFPAGALPPVTKARLIDDVPFLTFTLWSETADPLLMRDLAGALEEEIRTVPEVSVTGITGGRRRQLEILLDPEALASAGLTTRHLISRLQAANAASPAGELLTGERSVLVRTDAFLRSVDDVRAVVVGVRNERPIRLDAVARIEEVGEPTDYAVFLAGAAAGEKNIDLPSGHAAGAVTLTVAKRKGADATRVAEAVIHRVEDVRGRILPGEVHLTLTRDYGETADEKAGDLLLHLFMAVVSVTVVIALTLGLRGSMVIFISVPITFALTLFTYYLFGYTLNRVTLFALIFVTGIVVDDSIIVVENIFRHYKTRRARRPGSAILAAVSEVGNPTVLATLTVIVSVFPMAYVGGLMGPYMRPMPIGAALAMTFSLLVALTVSPWLSRRLLKPGTLTTDDETESAPPGIRRFYRRLVGPMLARPRRGVIALSVTAGLLGLAMLMLPLKLVTVKMLPFDNKSEIQVLLDFPDGTPLETSLSGARDVAAALAKIPEVTDLQVYAGAAAPHTFNGLVRHYDLRRAPNLADVQINLLPKKERKRQSHELASVVRAMAGPVAAANGALLKIVEVPPGPPVLSTLVAEVYGPDQESRIALARKVRDVFESTPGVVDVDWLVDDPQPQWILDVDPTRAALAGVDETSVTQAVQLALAGIPVGSLHPDDAFEDVPLTVRWPRGEGESLEDLGDIRVSSTHGTPVPAAAVIEPHRTERRPARHRKDGTPLVYVIGEVAGAQESPVYAILDMKDRIAALTGSTGETVAQHFADNPANTTAAAVRWDGEWDITRKVFRDLGIAFGVVLILIYMLITAWFQDFRTPLVMMTAIPLSLVGIIPGHWILGGFFTATSMIGFIALAGIMVRNSVLLLDFVNLARERGLSLEEAVLEAGAVRLRPIALTAGTVVVGAIVILFDPIFEGLAISLMAGSIASTVLTLVAVPVLFYMMERGRAASPASAEGDTAETTSPAPQEEVTV
jgi:multidrug efflux pump subunit AcrB